MHGIFGGQPFHLAKKSKSHPVRSLSKSGLCRLPCSQGSGSALAQRVRLTLMSVLVFVNQDSQVFNVSDWHHVFFKRVNVPCQSVTIWGVSRGEENTCQPMTVEVIIIIYIKPQLKDCRLLQRASKMCNFTFSFLHQRTPSSCLVYRN